MPFSFYYAFSHLDRRHDLFHGEEEGVAPGVPQLQREGVLDAEHVVDVVAAAAARLVDHLVDGTVPVVRPVLGLERRRGRLHHTHVVGVVRALGGNSIEKKLA